MHKCIIKSMKVVYLNICLVNLIMVINYIILCEFKIEFIVFQNLMVFP